MPSARVLRALAFIGALGSGGPAWATAGWDYTCKAADARLAIDAAIAFGAGTIGPIKLQEANIQVKPGAKANADAPDATFTHEEVEQFWTDDSRFMLAISTYIGDAPETARLGIETKCKDRHCLGSYTFSWKGKPLTGKIRCEQSEAG